MHSLSRIPEKYSMFMFPNRLRRHACLAALLVMISAADVRGAEPVAPVDSLVESLIALRGQVEQLDNRVRELARERDNRMATLLRQEAELAAERQRQVLRLKKIEQQITQQKKTMSSPDIGGEKLTPVLRDAIEEARRYVRSSLPFKQIDRLAALQQMEDQLNGNLLEPSRVANQLWAFLADEIQLAGEVGLFRQPLEVEGDARLVDVARIGMMNLYFRTDDNRVGYWVPGKNAGGFRYAEGAAQDQIRNLMAALRTNVRSGYFVLPTAAQHPEGD